MHAQLYQDHVSMDVDGSDWTEHDVCMFMEEFTLLCKVVLFTIEFCLNEPLALESPGQEKPGTPH